ncbi:aminoglycoside phosphotransferase family protein [Actinacidiphila epipremni]|uniref:Aminoglycoside phosphotransferase family protein n=1 Tax=Actinacidiphila epipremni TaxID=2053013 RepID=A0ABX0ZRZ2_9ACTN|nr:aminoglycoside phosphotransferase family protein [Actinacidiphila epipremni]NJP45996.1 aminoglycoside phosphotransferase family protein [Actinacidiphila epipremni]
MSGDGDHGDHDHDGGSGRRTRTDGFGGGEPAPPARGVRTPWEALPPDVRAAVESRLGSPVLVAATQPAGFSPGVAARLRLADGRRAFVKAVSAAQNPESPRLHRDEARIAGALTAAVPAPRLLAAIEADGWVALLFEDVEGRHPAQPWVPHELDLVLRTVAELARLLTPSPVAAPPVAGKDGAFRGWRTLAADHAAGTDDLAGLDPWAARQLDALAALEAGWAEGAAGDTLAHADLRADNLLITPEGRVVVVDWPWACLAAPWYDLVLLLPSVRMQGGPPPQSLFVRHPVADPGAVTSLVAAVAGFFLGNARRPAPPGLPTLRPFQAGQGRAALAWLRSRLDD